MSSLYPASSMLRQGMTRAIDASEKSIVPVHTDINYDSERYQ